MSRWWSKRPELPQPLRDAMGPDERLLARAELTDGRVLVASRFGLWAADHESAVRWDWHLISKARLSGTALRLTVADVVDHWPGDIAVLRDRPELALELTATTKLTDLVHDRVRRSVAASYHLEWPDAGGWVVLRKVPGRDGLASQVRLDADADSNAEEFAAAVTSIRDQLWPPSVPGPP